MTLSRTAAKVAAIFLVFLTVSTTAFGRTRKIQVLMQYHLVRGNELTCRGARINRFPIRIAATSTPSHLKLGSKVRLSRIGRVTIQDIAGPKVRRKRRGRLPTLEVYFLRNERDLIKWYEKHLNARIVSVKVID